MIMENLSKLKKCGYYIVKWTSDSYTFQSPHKMVKYIIKAGELVCDVVYFNPLANFKQCIIHIKRHTREKTIRLNNVILTKVKSQ